MRSLQLTYFACVINLALSCSDAAPREEESSPPPDGKKVCSWESGIGLVFEKQCGSCHPGQRPTNYKTFDSVANSITEVMNRINDGSMPPGGLNKGDLALVTTWTQNQHPETDATSTYCGGP